MAENTSIDIEQKANEVREILEKILSFIHAAGRIERKIRGNKIIFNILNLSRAQSEMLTEKGGRVLLSLEYIINRIVERTTSEKMRIIVDVDGYKGRKERRARELARVSAERVKRLGKRVTLTGLDAHERRIVHLYFREDPEIITLSEGEGAEKKVIIQKREKT